MNITYRHTHTHLLVNGTFSYLPMFMNKFIKAGFQYMNVQAVGNKSFMNRNAGNACRLQFISHLLAALAFKLRGHHSTVRTRTPVQESKRKLIRFRVDLALSDSLYLRHPSNVSTVLNHLGQYRDEWLSNNH